MEAIEELAQLSDSMRQAAAVLADEDVDENSSSSSSSKRPATFLNVVVLGNTVNGCRGKMGKSVVEAAILGGLDVVPASFGSEEDTGKTVEVGGKEIELHSPAEREKVLSSLFHEHPSLIVVDYTVPSAVNDNAELYCKIGVPFAMGTTGGDRERLYKTVEDSRVYAVISPQMGKQGAGKSAVLNSLIGHPALPTGEGGATRAPICIDLKRDIRSEEG